MYALSLGSVPKVFQRHKDRGSITMPKRKVSAVELVEVQPLQSLLPNCLITPDFWGNLPTAITKLRVLT